MQEVNPATGAVIREFTSATHAARVTGFFERDHRPGLQRES